MTGLNPYLCSFLIYIYICIYYIYINVYVCVGCERAVSQRSLPRRCCGAHQDSFVRPTPRPAVTHPAPSESHNRKSPVAEDPHTHTHTRTSSRVLGMRVTCERRCDSTLVFPLRWTLDLFHLLSFGCPSHIPRTAANYPSLRPRRVPRAYEFTRTPDTHAHTHTHTHTHTQR